VKLEKELSGIQYPIKERYVVESISPQDIAKPDQYFVTMVTQLVDFPFLKSFSVEDFSARVQERFGSRKR